MSEPTIWGALKDKQFWKDSATRLVGIGDTLRSWGDIPGEADRIAEEQFGSASARDSSTKNAFRHALGTGMLTHAMGGTAMSAGLAKLAGWGWEGIGAMRDGNYKNPAYLEDSRHDLNANAIGARTAANVSSQQELVDALKAYALQSVPKQAPGAFAPSPGYMTRSEQ